MIHLPIAGVISGGGSEPDSLLTDLVSWWTLDEESGTRYDAHGSLDLTDNNTVGYAAGKAGNAADFTPANSEKLERLNDANIATHVNGSFTITGWFNLDSVSDGVHDCILTIKNNLNSISVKVVVIDNSHGTYPGYLYSLWYKADGTQYFATPAQTLSASTWYFFAYEYDSDNDQLTLDINDGAYTDSVPTSGSIRANSEDLRIGADNTTEYFDGLLDEMTFHSRVLTAAEKTRIFSDVLTYADIKP